MLALSLVAAAAFAAPVAAVPFSRALLLDCVDDYASVADSASLDLGDQDGEDFTLEAFFYVPDQSSDAAQIIAWKQYAYALFVNFNDASDDVVLFRFWSCPSSFCQNDLYKSTNLANGWHHVAAVFDNEWSGTNDRAAIYLDGAELASTTAFEMTPGMHASTNVLSIGGAMLASWFDGWLDEVRFSDTVRYSGAYTVPTAAFSNDASTRALWHFDEAPCSTSFTDSSGNGNTASGQNGAQTGDPSAAGPTLKFGASNYYVKESVGTASVTVTRSGDSLPEVSVSYARTGGSATQGSDFGAFGGTLDFACGQTTRSFGVPIVNDAAAENEETIRIGLSSPTGGASLGSPSTTTLRIKKSDQRPDALIADCLTCGFAGNGIYNTTGENQTKQKTAQRGQTRSFFVRIQNDGTSTNTMAAQGSGSPSGATVRYFLGDTATEITSAMRSTAGYQATLGVGANLLIRVEIKILSGASIGAVKSATVTGVWRGDVVLRDVVKAGVEVTG